MALPPQIANVHANNMLPAVAGAPANVRACQARKRTRAVENLEKMGVATEAEVGNHQVFELMAVADLNPPAAAHAVAPAWFMLAMAPVNAQLTALNNRLERSDSYMKNILSESPDDALFALPNDTGNVPANFPSTRREFEDLGLAEINALLGFYGLGLGANCRKARLNRLRRFIGVRTALHLA